MADTPMRKSKTSTDDWKWVFKVMKKSRTISAKELERQLGVTYKTAWRMKRIVVDNLVLFDSYFNELIDEDWSQKPDWMQRREDYAFQSMEQALTVGVEFNYKKVAAEAYQRISEKYAKK